MKFNVQCKIMMLTGQIDFPLWNYRKYSLGVLLTLLVCFSCSTPQEQKKPTVAIVTWDETAKEGQDVGSI